MTPPVDALVVSADPDAAGAGLISTAGRQSPAEEHMGWAIPFAITIVAALALFVEQIASKTAVFQ